MKRLCLILAFLFLFMQTASAMPLLIGQKVVYRGTVTGLRISAVDGTAFIDNALITPELQNAKLLSSGSVTAANLKLSAVDGTAFVDFSTADVLTDNIGKYIVIKDSTGKEIKGWIKAAGTGETLGDEVLSSWTNYGTVPFETFTSTGLAISEATETGTAGRALGNTTTTELALYKFGFTTTKLSGTFSGSHVFVFSAAASGNYVNTNHIITLASGAQSGYGTISPTFNTVSWRTASAISFAITDFTYKQVLSPSSTGVTIVSSKGGTTYNWESKDASFAYNSAITYSIYDRDLTAYADGNHQIEIYDASNRMLRGVLKAAGSGVTTNTVYTADFSAGLDGWGVSWSTGYVVGSFLWDTDHTVLTVAGNSNLNLRPYISRTLSMTVGALQFLEMDYSVVSGTAVITGERVGGEHQSLTNTLSGTDTHITSQQTCAGTYYNKLYLYFNGMDYDFVLNINAMRVKAITAPSSSGATIVSAKGGETYNWAYRDASFSYNSSSYYVIIRAIR